MVNWRCRQELHLHRFRLEDERLVYFGHGSKFENGRSSRIFTCDLPVPGRAL